MLKERASGVLMHISSLPSKYGIGVLMMNVFILRTGLHR